MLDLVLHSCVKKGKGCKSPNRGGCRDVHPRKRGTVLVLVSRRFGAVFVIGCRILVLKRTRDGNPPIGVVAGM